MPHSSWKPACGLQKWRQKSTIPERLRNHIYQNRNKLKGSTNICLFAIFPVSHTDLKEPASEWDPSPFLVQRSQYHHLPLRRNVSFSKKRHKWQQEVFTKNTSRFHTAKSGTHSWKYLHWKPIWLFLRRERSLPCSSGVGGGLGTHKWGVDCAFLKVPRDFYKKNNNKKCTLLLWSLYFRERTCSFRGEQE